MNEKFKLLRQTLNADDIEIRVGTVGAKGATLLIYKTARVDGKVLDNIFGGHWQRKHYNDSHGNNVCIISIYDVELQQWISREDVGTESNTEKEKGSYSDSFKRAGFAWGIGVELYDAPFIFVNCETIKNGSKYKLQDPYFFNDAYVSEFYVKNNEVFLTVKKKKGSQQLYSNIVSNQQAYKIDTKENKEETFLLYKTDRESLIISDTPEDFDSIKEQIRLNWKKYNKPQQDDLHQIINTKKQQLNIA